MTYMFILKCALKLVLKISYTMMHGRKNIKIKSYACVSIWILKCQTSHACKQHDNEDVVRIEAKKFGFLNI